MNTKVRRALRLITGALVGLLVLVVAHYQLWLRSFEGADVTVKPGKWVWVECKTQPFSARLEILGLSGVTLSSDLVLPGIPCAAVGVTSLGAGKYFFPFQTILSVEAAGRFPWKNPFPI